ncbi:Inner kinetochore subunit fta7 [Schizosaccharomyces pombe]
MKRRVRAVRRDQIQKRWRPLEDKQRQEIIIIFRTCSRLVLNTIKSETRKSLAEEWFMNILLKIEAPLRNLPVPRKRKESILFSQLLSSNMQLEQQLYSDLDHINVLQQELKVETARLENEQKSYEEMKQNMAINNSRLADLKSKLHPYLKKGLKISHDNFSDSNDFSFQKKLNTEDSNTSKTSTLDMYKEKLKPFTKTMQIHANKTVQLSQTIQKATLLLQRLNNTKNIGLNKSSKLKIKNI